MMSKLSEAIDRGAVKMAYEYYPGTTLDYGRGAVFAVRYFDSNNREVGYYIPDMADFTPVHWFDEPREWGAEAFAKLTHWLPIV